MGVDCPVEFDFCVWSTFCLHWEEPSCTRKTSTEKEHYLLRAHATTTQVGCFADPAMAGTACSNSEEGDKYEDENKVRGPARVSSSKIPYPNSQNCLQPAILQVVVNL